MHTFSLAQEVLPVAVKLAEKVFENCAVKLKPYLSQAIKSLGVSLDDYSEVVAAVCEGSSSTVEHTNENASTVQLVCIPTCQISGFLRICC